MIQSFADKNTAALFDRRRVRKFAAFERSARHKLEMLHAALVLDELRSPPGNRLEALKGNRKGQFSIRINGQWRICFIWKENGPHKLKLWTITRNKKVNK